MTNYRFRVLLGIAIILVVFGHTGVKDLTFNGLFPVDTFHMALFLFISGYFYKDDVENTPWNKSFIYKKIHRLLIPYIFWCIFYGVLTNIFKSYISKNFMGMKLTLDNIPSIIARQINIGNAFELNIASWFIVMLFFSCIFNYFIRKIFFKIYKNKTYSKDYKIDLIIFIIYLLFIITCIYCAKKNFNFHFSNFIYRTGYSLFFYHIGYCYKQYIEKFDTINNYIYFFVIFTIQITAYFLSYLKIGIVYSSQFYSNILFTILLAINGIALWLRISKLLEPLLTNFNIFIYLSNRTFSIMMHHGFFIFILKSIFAILALKLSIFNNFDFNKYYSHIWYMYIPLNNQSFRFIYALVGILCPLSICYIYEKVLNSFHLKKFK